MSTQTYVLDTSTLVTASDIAEAVGVGATVARTWIQRHQGELPDPAIVIPSKRYATALTFWHMEDADLIVALYQQSRIDRGVEIS